VGDDFQIRMNEKMKTVVWCWNLIHWYIFLWQGAWYRILPYANPLTYLVKIPFVERLYLSMYWKKRGVTSYDEVNQIVQKEILNNPKTGLNTIWAWGYILILAIFIELIIISASDMLIGKHLWKIILKKGIFFDALPVILPIIWNYFTLFRHDRYLNYFKEFEKFPKEKRLKYGWVCFGFVLMAILLSFGSSIYVVNVMK
jgi:hypothetical protein